MNLKQLLKKTPVVLLRPIPIEVEDDLERRVDHAWHIDGNTAEPRTVRLSCPSTRHSKIVDSTVIANYMRERRHGDVEGILVLRAQVILRGNDMLLEPVPPRPVGGMYGEFVEDVIVRILQEHGRLTTKELIRGVLSERIHVRDREFFDPLSRLLRDGVVIVVDSEYYDLAPEHKEPPLS